MTYRDYCLSHPVTVETTISGRVIGLYHIIGIDGAWWTWEAADYWRWEAWRRE